MLFRNVSRLIGTHTNIEFGDRAQCTGANGVRVLSVHSGDVIEVQCSTDNHFISHYPVVHQVIDQRRNRSFPLLWGVSTIFRWENCSRNHEIWASVRLCEVILDVAVQSRIIHGSKKFLMGDEITLLKLHPNIRPTAVLRNCSP